MFLLKYFLQHHRHKTKSNHRARKSSSLSDIPGQDTCWHSAPRFSKKSMCLQRHQLDQNRGQRELHIRRKHGHAQPEAMTADKTQTAPRKSLLPTHHHQDRERVRSNPQTPSRPHTAIFTLELPSTPRLRPHRPVWIGAVESVFIQLRTTTSLETLSQSSCVSLFAIYWCGTQTLLHSSVERQRFVGTHMGK